ncbi:Ig-like V-type domain-containing protein FAM187A [Octopus bimaculoides]|uniref:Ig-like domain-containing protein n=1 Tax=Octopus bimaculoides TaxID=37653 RepID=A0A0L8FQJ9_OCTBM|nr:Ig-like V-type domain-containing protein FAM187A [Octopus bimaculoides]|eukprot:XP_014787984.1 PREDICTED: Ig-like V-type domain-containing protein FAM187A [Octopus bimaculoides]
MFARKMFYFLSIFEQLCYVIFLAQMPKTECGGHERSGFRNVSGNGKKDLETWLGMPEMKLPRVHEKMAQESAMFARRSLNSVDDVYKLNNQRRKKLPYTLAMDLLTQYYNCIKRTHTRQRSVYQTYITKPGQRLLLKCHQCFKPGATTEMKAKVTWQHLQEKGTVLSRIQSNGNYKITPNRDLIIKAINSELDGYYYCTNGNRYEAIHHLTTVTSTQFHAVSENTTKSLLTMKNLTRNNLKIFSSWSNWSKCSHCGKEGFRRKIGLCTIKKLNERAPVRPVDIYIFYYFTGSLSCQSTALPKQIRELPAIKSRPNEVFYNKCQVACPKKEGRTIIKDQAGKVVEVVMPGYLSLHQKRKMAHPVIRDVIYTMEGSDVIIRCRTDENIIRWQNRSKPLKHFLESRKTKGRVFIDVTNSLHIRNTQFTDTSLYSCWKRNILLQTTKLVVTESMLDSADPYIIYSLSGITIFGLLMTSCCMYSGRHRGMAR